MFIIRNDIMFFKWTYKISFALNWLTGKEPKAFFPVIWFNVPLMGAANIIDEASHWWTVILVFLFTLVTAFCHVEKYLIEVEKVHPAEYAFNRVWWGWLSMLALISAPFGNPLGGACVLVAYLLLWYCKYCHLHDLPPRDSVFARAKNSIKEKLGSFSLAPSPA